MVVDTKGTSTLIVRKTGRRLVLPSSSMDRDRELWNGALIGSGPERFSGRLV